MPVRHIVVDVDEESLSAHRDPRAAAQTPPELKVTLYSFATYDEAMRIRNEGFTDSDTQGEAGFRLRARGRVATPR